MVPVGRLVVALALSGLFMQSLHADVIPTRRAADTTESARKVENRLLQLGVTQEAAKEQIQKLTDEQTAYFAGDPERIQLVGQENWGGQSDNLWWEWLFGIIALAGVAFFIIYEINNS